MDKELARSALTLLYGIDNPSEQQIAEYILFTSQEEKPFAGQMTIEDLMSDIHGETNELR